MAASNLGLKMVDTVPPDADLTPSPFTLPGNRPDDPLRGLGEILGEFIKSGAGLRRLLELGQ